MKRTNFTLVELLVVIAIIGVLSALIFPAIQGSITKAETAKCKAGITTLVNAIKQYESTYGKLPTPKKSSDGTASHLCCGVVKNEEYYNALIRILQNEEFSATDSTDAFGSVSKYNKRGIKFLDIQGNNPGIYLDPWDNQYNVLLDLDYDGNITPASGELNGVSSESTKLYYSIIVWSIGDDGESSTTANNKKNKDNVYSFTTNWTPKGHTLQK